MLALGLNPTWALLALTSYALLGVALKLYETTFGKDNPIAIPHTFLFSNGVSVVAFLALAFSLFYFARKPLKK